MHYPLDGCWSKVVRANEHLHALDTEIRRWLEVHAQPATSGHFYPEAKVHVFWWDVPHPPLEWGVRIGDVVHNLRSALDHLVWQLSTSPKAGVGGNQFPIFRDKPPQGFDAKTKHGMLYAVRPDDRAKIEGLQPYVRDPGSEDDNALILLKYLSNVDKHRIVHVLALAQPFGSMPFTAFAPNEDAGPVKTFWVSPGGNLKPGAVFACFEVYEVRGPNPQVNVEGGPTVQIHLEDGRNAIRTLSDIAEAVNQIVNYFIPSFGGGDWSASAFYREN